MPKIKKISIQVNNSEYSVKPGMVVDENTVLVLPLRAFVGAEHFGATRNMKVKPMFFKESDIRRVLDID